MRIAPCLLLSLAIAAHAHAADAVGAKPIPATPAVSPPKSAPLTARTPSMPMPWPEMKMLMDIESQARLVYPRRRDTPLRDLNITDGEVREIQLIARDRAMHELVNISPVVTGCPCQEGANCTEQAHVVGNHKGSSLGLQLSRNRSRWDVSVVQKWWLEYDALRARENSMERSEFLAAWRSQLLAFPQCGENTRAATNKASTATTAVNQ